MPSFIDDAHLRAATRDALRFLDAALALDLIARNVDLSPLARALLDTLDALDRADEIPLSCVCALTLALDPYPQSADEQRASDPVRVVVSR